jgi:GTPase SAR1 family protein
MVGTIFIIGTAGSGKSELTSALASFLRGENLRVAILNLDPGVWKTPYTPDVDIRDYVDIQEIMDKYGLGPNGSLILAMDLGTDYIERFNDDVREMNPDYLIVDTSGQMELFAYRSSGSLFANSIHGETRSILFLLDGLFCKDPRNFVSTALLSTSIHFRFQQPVVNLLTKIDLLSQQELKREVNWSRKPITLIKSLSKGYYGEETPFLERIVRLIHGYFGETWFIPISSHTLDNFSTLVSAITRIHYRGEERLS